MSILWLFELFFIHARVETVLDKAGSEMVAYSYPLFFNDADEDESLKTEALLKVGWTEGYIKGQILKLPESYRITGLTTLLSNISKDDEIDILVTYIVKPYINIPFINGVILTNHFYSKAYTGYGRKDTDNDEMVYITRRGTVYHTDLDCKALKVTIIPVPISGIKKERNEDGGRYYPCEYCKDEGFGATVYITPYGTAYHSSQSCGQLKQDVFQIPLSEAGGRHKCKLCGKKEQ